MFEEILSKTAKESLALLGGLESIKKSYLAGGTAAALQLGHRFSFDFDLFTPEQFEVKILAQLFQKELRNFKLERTAWGTIYGYIQESKTKKNRFSFLYYQYPLLFPTQNYLGVNLAHLKDIGAMKIAAISDRGSKRDFIDLYFLCQKNILDIKETLSLYNQKYKTLEQNKIHILRSLTYFADAEKQTMPKMIKEVDWKKVQEFFTKEVKKISREILK
mgnify:CR=1 FL=1